MNFTRYALYFAPPTNAPWRHLATAWLGWDMETGQSVAHPAAAGLDVGDITSRPRKYGLHGTMKPPFRLAEGTDRATLEAATAEFCARTPPVTLDGLEVAPMGAFLALQPVGDVSALRDLAGACVKSLDHFRAPAPDAELERRRGAGLSAAQEAHLLRWGYPYVMDQFRFHITLSGRLDADLLSRTQAFLTDYLTAALPKPFAIDDLALVGEAEDGRFHLIQRYTLSG